MNYLRHYQLLVEKRLATPAEPPAESHHIIARCMGGSDRKYNRVSLTPEEHYVAHLLLRRIHPEVRGLWYAMMRMSAWGRGSRIYGAMRRADWEEKQGDAPRTPT